MKEKTCCVDARGGARGSALRVFVGGAEERKGRDGDAAATFSHAASS